MAVAPKRTPLDLFSGITSPGNDGDTANLEDCSIDISTRPRRFLDRDVLTLHHSCGLRCSQQLTDDQFDVWIVCAKI